MQPAWITPALALVGSLALLHEIVRNVGVDLPGYLGKPTFAAGDDKKPEEKPKA